jgi:hypothetical protein
VLVSVSHTLLQPPQLVAEMKMFVSQPSVSGVALLQSAQPATQPFG